MKNNLLLVFISVSFFSNAQINRCAFDYFKSSIVNSDSKNLQKEREVNQIIYNRTIAQSLNSKSTRTVYTIPVVVHIIHYNGPENISDSTIIAGINELNLRFQNAAPYFDSTGHPVDIQFCLASVDPQGNPTTGITRTYSSLSYFNASNDVQMKNLNRWDSYYY